MRSGVNLIPESAVQAIVGLAVEAERLGFERCWVYDEGLATRDVHVTMTAIASATTAIEIGPGITNPYTRHPAQTAAAIASLDELSGGRAFLGVGAGGSLTLDPLGLERTRPLTAVGEMLEATRALFGDEPVDYHGRHVRLRSARISYARPDIEIWLAGRGPRMLELGGAQADGVMLDFIHVDTLGEYAGRVLDGAATTGNRPRLCYSTAIVTDADDLEFVRPHMTYRLVDAPDRVKEMLGLGVADVDRIRSAMADGLEAAAVHVEDDWILPFVISGTEDRCVEQLQALTRNHGIDEFLLPLFGMPDPGGYLARCAAILEAV